MVFRRIYTLIKEFIMLEARDAMKRFILAFGAVCLILTSVLMFAQTAARYIFQYSFYWSDELARYAIIWGAQLCAAVGVSERTHTALDFLVSKLPSVVHSIVNLLLDVLYMVFSAALFYYSFSNISLGMKSVSAGLGLPMGYVYAALTVSMVCTIIFLLFNIAEDIKLLTKPKDV